MNEIITAGEKCPMLTFVDSFKTTRPLPENPTNAINTPIPPVTACFIFSGMEFTTASRTLKSVKNINIIPSQNTAVRAVCQLIPPFNTTVNAKITTDKSIGLYSKGELTVGSANVTATDGAINFLASEGGDIKINGGNSITGQKSLLFYTGSDHTNQGKVLINGTMTATVEGGTTPNTRGNAFLYVGKST